MKKAPAAKASPRMSDEAVQAKTGKTWNAWFAILDRAGCAKQDHKSIVAYLSNEHGVSSWWRQMVAVTYEQARGLREKHEKPSGYSITRSKTLSVPVDLLFAAWQDPKVRSKWLKGEKLVVRKATASKSMRITWSDGTTNVDVGFLDKGTAKCQVAVEHSKLRDANQAEAMKAYWGEALDRLQAVLEK